MNCSTCNIPGAPHDLIAGLCHKCTHAAFSDAWKDACRLKQELYGEQCRHDSDVAALVVTRDNLRSAVDSALAEMGKWQTAALKCGLYRGDADVSTAEKWQTQQANAASALLVELQELREWKRSALAVEASWDKQAVARLLGVKLGEDISPAIQPAIEALLERLRKAEADCKTALNLLENAQVAGREAVESECRWRERGAKAEAELRIAQVTADNFKAHFDNANLCTAHVGQKQEQCPVCLAQEALAGWRKSNEQARSFQALAQKAVSPIK